MHSIQRPGRPRLLLAAMVAAGLAAPACNRADVKSKTETPAPAQASNPTPAATKPTPPPQVKLTGCLQQGTHGTYILTALNRPAQPHSSDPSVVAREDLAAASHAYRLSASSDKNLSKLVGRTIQVDGTVTQPSDLGPSTTPSAGTVGTAGDGTRPASRASGRHHIDQGDLAKVEVSSVTEIANVCGKRAKARRTVKRP